MDAPLVQPAAHAIQQDGNGVGLFAGSTARTPESKRLLRPPGMIDQPPDDMVLKRLKHMLVSEEVGLSDGQMTHQRLYEVGGGRGMKDFLGVLGGFDKAGFAGCGSDTFGGRLPFWCRYRKTGMPCSA